MLQFKKTLVYTAAVLSLLSFVHAAGFNYTYAQNGTDWGEAKHKAGAEDVINYCGKNDGN